MIGLEISWEINLGHHASIERSANDKTIQGWTYLICGQIGKKNCVFQIAHSNFEKWIHTATIMVFNEKRKKEKKEEKKKKNKLDEL